MVLIYNIADRFILQYLDKIANYVNNVFKNVVDYGNLISLLMYASKFIVKSLKFGFWLLLEDWNFQHDRL